MVIDIHGHLGNINLATFWRADAGKLEEICRQSGVDRLCVSSSRSLMYDIHEGNMELDQALRETEKLLGYVVASPTHPASLEDLSLLKSNPKFRGVKVHPDYHGYRLEAKTNRDFLEDVADRTSLMLFHVSCMPGSGFSPGHVVAEIARNHPRTNFVLAHMAGIFQNGNYPYFPNMDELELVAQFGLPNVFVDTAHFLMYVYPGVMERMVQLIGARQIVFGSDVPLQGAKQIGFALDIIRSLDISGADKELILSGNAEKILNPRKERVS